MTPRFQLAGFPVQIHPFFFLTALAMGFQWLSQPARLVVWFCVFFASVLMHELGHALMFRRWGVGSSIELHGLGGTTTPEDGPPLTHRQNLWVSLAGPGAGLLLAAVAYGLYRFTPLGRAGGLVEFTVWYLLWANLVLSIFNLLPIYPLDGGHALGAVIRRRGGARAEWLVHLISLVTAGALIVFAIVRQDRWLGMAGLIFAVLNAAPLWRTRVERRHMLQLRSARTTRRAAPSDDEAAASVNRLLEDLRLDSHAPSAPPRPPATEPRSPAPARARAPEPPEPPELPDLPHDPQFMGQWLLDNGLSELAIRPLQAAFTTQPSMQVGHLLVTALLDTGRYEEVARLLTGPGAEHLGAETLEFIATRAQAAGQSALLERARALSSGRPHDSEKPD
ncbi:MAG TPA: M50 family metallopeptidase [Myxococcaceae bacterium]|jgi:Zn-dependent protease